MLQWRTWVNECCLVAQSCQTLLQPHELYPTRLLCPWDFPGKNTGVSCHFILQGIFLTHESNPGLLHWQVDSLPLSHQGCPLCAYLPSSSSYFIWGVFLWVELDQVLHFTNCYLPSAVAENCGMFLKNTANGVYCGHISCQSPHSTMLRRWS